jgi:6-pyruvoyl-tetrahydropterin synthase
MAEKTKEDEIIANGVEAETDALNNMKLIEKSEYEALPDSEKTKWVKYNPSLTSQAYVQWINAQNQLIEQFNKLGPAISKMGDLEGMDFSASLYESLEGICSAFKSAYSAVGGISSAASKVGLGALTSIFEGIFQMIGGIAGMLYTMVANPYNMLVQYEQALEQIDYAALKEQFSGETTPNIDAQKAELNDMVIPDKEIKEYVNNNVDTLDKQKTLAKKQIEKVETAKTTIQTAKTIQDTMKAVSAAMATAAAGIVQTAENAMESSYEASIKALSADYSSNAQEMTTGVNDFIHNMPQKYIKTSDLELLKKIEEERQKEEEDPDVIVVG